MFYTYVLKEMDSNHYYVGSTRDLKRRMSEHQSGQNRATKGRTWKLHCYFAFNEDKIAREFEKYLKTGSGRAFIKRHLNQ